MPRGYPVAVLTTVLMAPTAISDPSTVTAAARPDHQFDGAP